MDCWQSSIDSRISAADEQNASCHELHLVDTWLEAFCHVKKRDVFDEFLNERSVLVQW
jgi:hypothetical protein